MKGLSGPITVNGVNYNNIMPPQSQLSEAEVADVITYILNSWGNKGGTVTPNDVKRSRSENP